MLLTLFTSMLDYEADEIKVTKEVLSESNIITCQVHWHRALRKKLTDIGLVPHCNRDITIQVFFRKLWALAFVPEEDVLTVWDKIVDDVPELDEENEDQ